MTIDWTAEQRDIIEALPTERLVVEAAPGTGKTQVAAGRVAWLLDDRVNPTQILVVSFTRTAVREIRERIASYSGSSPRVAQVRITTIDSQSWGLRNGFEEAEVKALGPDITYHTNLERLVRLFDERCPGLLQFMGELEHVIIDEAQDVVGVRALLLQRMIGALNATCGVTIFADPAQAIYGFTTDRSLGPGVQPPPSLLDAGGCTASMKRRPLTKLFRTDVRAIVNLFERARECVTSPPSKSSDDVERMKATLREHSPAEGSEDEPSDKNDDLRGRDDALVLYRYRAEVVRASSFLSSARIEHRLRLSGMPTVVFPWIGHLFSECVSAALSRQEFDELWSSRIDSSLMLGQPSPEAAWNLLRGLAGNRLGLVDLALLRRILARPRPPIEVCQTEVGTQGPTLGTIHASKGREAPFVRVVIPKPHEQEETDWPEEARVLYVAATRGRTNVELRYSYGIHGATLSTDRIYTQKKKDAFQFEFGLEGDVDKTVHATWPEARAIQEQLARLAGKTSAAVAAAHPETDWRYDLTEASSRAKIGAFSKRVNQDIWEAIKRYQTRHRGRYRPSDQIRHLSVVGVTTVAVTEDDNAPLRSPYLRSRLFLAPVIRGFSLVYFNRCGGRA